MIAEVGEFTLSRREIRKTLLVALYMHHGVDVNLLAKLPGFEFINEEMKKMMGENHFDGATIVDLGGRVVSDWNEEIKDREGDEWN